MASCPPLSIIFSPISRTLAICLKSHRYLRGMVLWFWTLYMLARVSKRDGSRFIVQFCQNMAIWENIMYSKTARAKMWKIKFQDKFLSNVQNMLDSTILNWWWGRISPFVAWTWLDGDQFRELSLNWVGVWGKDWSNFWQHTFGEGAFIGRRTFLLLRVDFESTKVAHWTFLNPQRWTIEHVPKVRNSQLFWHDAASNLKSVHKSNISFERSQRRLFKIIWLILTDVEYNQGEIEAG